MSLTEPYGQVLWIIAGADRESSGGRIARVEVMDWAGSQGLEPSSVAEVLSSLERAGLVTLSGMSGGTQEESGRFVRLTDAGREWTLRHGDAARLPEGVHEELLAGDEEHGEWGYRITVPPAGRPWDVLIQRRLFHTSRPFKAVGIEELPYVTFYFWRCSRPTYAGQVTIDADRIGQYPSTRDEALATAKSYILEYEESLARDEEEG